MKSFCVVSRRFVAVTFLIVALTALSSGQVRGGRSVYLGSAHLDGNRDNDKIKCHGKDTYRAIQLRVSGSAVRFDHVVIVYGNHQSQTLSIRSQIPAGGSSRSIDLPGARRDIDYVELWYAKAHWGAKPEVQLYGMP